MKTNSKGSLYQGRRFRFSFATSTFLNKLYCALLFAAFLIIGLTATIKAEDGKHGNGGSIISSDTHHYILDLRYITGQTDFIEANHAGKEYLAVEFGQTAINGNGNMPLSNVGTTDTVPVVTLVADYCVVAGKVRLTASSSPIGGTYMWSTGQAGSVIDVDIANMYLVVAAFSNGATATASIRVAEELVINGDFSSGNTGFFSEYGYAPDIAGNSELNPEGLYGIGISGQDYHSQFFGKEHSTTGQTGNFMIINGSTTPIGSPPRQKTIWQQTVAVLPNTNYYFSAYGMNVNPSSPAQLQFEVNGVRVGTIADLNLAAKPNSNGTVNINNWIRFYSNPTWNSGITTNAVIRIINLNSTASGNDFGLDDISFSTLSPFIKLVSATGTNAQTTCINAAITPVVYSVGSNASGHSIINLPPGITGSFSVPNFLTISGSPTTTGNYSFSITTTGTCNPVTVTGTINIPSASNNWSGSVNNDWSNASNWSCGTVPNLITNVIIPAAAIRMPMLTAISVCKVLEMQNATVLDLNGQLFTSFGGITGPGVFRGSPSSGLTIDAAGTSSTVGFDQSAPGTGNALNSLTVTGLANSVVLNTRLVLYGVLAPQNGTLTINDTLVLRSNAAGTARVDIVTGAFSYGSHGKVEVERYFPARRAWRLITSPLSNSGTIFDTWQNGGKYTAGIGTYVSGLGATNPTCDNGLDWTPHNNSSLKTGVTLTPVLNTRINLSKNIADSSDNIPYFIFVRGDRNPVNTNITLSNNTTLRSSGKLQTGRQTIEASSGTGGFTFVGNPYAAPVDFNKLVLNNLKKHFWVWDPYLNTDQGGFILIAETGAGNYDVIPPSPGGMNQVLQSGQAFFVETASNNPASIVFQETAKSNTNSNPTAFRPLGAKQSFRANLYHLNENDNILMLDGIMALFDIGFDKHADSRDIIKQNNSREMLALERDGKTLTLERRPLPESDDTLFLRLTKTTYRRYRFEFEPGGLDPALTTYLEDSYTGIKTILNVSSNSIFDFEINSDTASSAANRFRILFRQMAGLLPVTYKKVSAKQLSDDIIVSWTVANEINTREYEVEKSYNGITFKKVNTTTATGAGLSARDYEWIDQNRVTGNNYYRVRSISTGGKSEYSKTVVVKVTNDISGIWIQPGAASVDKIGINFKNMANGIYYARLLNVLGQSMLTTLINHTTATSLENIDPVNKLVAGIYQLVIVKPDQTTTSIKVILQ